MDEFRDDRAHAAVPAALFHWTGTGLAVGLFAVIIGNLFRGSVEGLLFGSWLWLPFTVLFSTWVAGALWNSHKATRCTCCSARRSGAFRTRATASRASVGRQRCTVVAVKPKDVRLTGRRWRSCGGWPSPSKHQMKDVRVGASPEVVASA